MKKIPDKCAQCAALPMAEVRSQHGPGGDGCYQPATCRSRRSYARNQGRVNEARRQRWRNKQEDLVAYAPPNSEIHAVLLIYRSKGYLSPIEAIATEVRRGRSRLAGVRPVACGGLSPKQVLELASAVLELLRKDFGIVQFSGVVRLSPRCAQKVPSLWKIEVAQPGLSDIPFAVLGIYRELGEAKVVRGVGVEVWRGGCLDAVIDPISCQGLNVGQVRGYINKVKMVLGDRYGLKRFSRMEVRSSEVLDFPVVRPDRQHQNDLTFDLEVAWSELQVAMGKEPMTAPAQALEVIGFEYERIVDRFVAFADEIFGHLHSQSADECPIMSDDEFIPDVRQTMDVDFSCLLAPPLARQRRVSGQVEAPCIQVLERVPTLDGQANEDLVQSYRQAIATAHDENVSAWAVAMKEWMREQELERISLLELQQALGMPLIKVWLAALLAGFEVQQQGEFYNSATIWITNHD